MTRCSWLVWLGVAACNAPLVDLPAFDDAGGHCCPPGGSRSGGSSGTTGATGSGSSNDAGPSATPGSGALVDLPDGDGLATGEDDVSCVVCPPPDAGAGDGG